MNNVLITKPIKEGLYYTMSFDFKTDCFKICKTYFKNNHFQSKEDELIIFWEENKQIDFNNLPKGNKVKIKENLFVENPRQYFLSSLEVLDKAIVNEVKKYEDIYYIEWW